MYYDQIHVFLCWQHYKTELLIITRGSKYQMRGQFNHLKEQFAEDWKH